MKHSIVMTSVFEVADGKQSEFESLLRNFALELQQTPGCVNVEAHRDPERFHRYLLYQRWDDLNTFQTNRDLPYFSRFFLYAVEMTNGETGNTTWIPPQNLQLYEEVIETYDDEEEEFPRRSRKRWRPVSDQEL